MKKNNLKVFDRILMGHFLVDLLTGLLAVPLFHVYSIFFYWPFNSFAPKQYPSPKKRVFKCIKSQVLMRKDASKQPFLCMKTDLKNVIHNMGKFAFLLYD
jgi:hypothetical protein